MPEASFASSPSARARMQSQPRRDTRPELALRRAVFERGLRYRIHRRPIPAFRRNLDLVFPSARVAVDVRGCYWHDCPEHKSRPKANADWWKAKLERNAARDAETAERLREEGWELIVVWEHEDVASAADRVERAVRARRIKTQVDAGRAGDPKGCPAQEPCAPGPADLDGDAVRVSNLLRVWRSSRQTTVGLHSRP